MSVIPTQRFFQPHIVASQVETESSADVAMSFTDLSLVSTTSVTSNYDVTNKNLLFVTVTVALVTITGFVGGIKGQVVEVMLQPASAANLVIADLGAGTQQINTTTGGDLTIVPTVNTTNSARFLFNGTAWFQI